MFIFDSLTKLSRYDKTRTLPFTKMLELKLVHCTLPFPMHIHPLLFDEVYL
jgi:hypothetical protein